MTSSDTIRAALSTLADAATTGATKAWPAGSPPEFSALMAKTNTAYSDGLAALNQLATLEAALRDGAERGECDAIRSWCALALAATGDGD